MIQSVGTSALGARPDPASRLRQRDAGAASAAIGWALALLLHAGLLAALILEQPHRLPPATGQPAISLLFEPPSGQPAHGQAVAPKPPPLPAHLPQAPPAVIANAPQSRPVAKPRPSRPVAAAPPSSRALAASAQGQAMRQTVAPAAQGFVAAEPLTGEVNQPPEYPAGAVAHGEQGRVLLSIHVLPDGRADFVGVIQSSGYRVLDEAAQQAVMQWRFRPAEAAGKPVVMVLPYWINFDLQQQSVQGIDGR
jgi:protein TonB